MRALKRFVYKRDNLAPLFEKSVVTAPSDTVSFIVHRQGWVEGWLPESVFSLANGRSSVEGWFSAALDIEEVLSGVWRGSMHVLVADVIKSFDTVDGSILDCALGRLGLLVWFRRVYFSYHSHVHLKFNGEPWCRDGSIPQGSPLSIVLIVALYVPWCRHLEVMPGVRV